MRRSALILGLSLALLACRAETEEDAVFREMARAFINRDEKQLDRALISHCEQQGISKSECVRMNQQAGKEAALFEMFENKYGSPDKWPAWAVERFEAESGESPEYWGQ